MSASSIVAMGFGSFGGVAFVPTLGFSSSDVVPLLYTGEEGRRASALTGDGRVSSRDSIDSVRMVRTVPDQQRAQ